MPPWTVLLLLARKDRSTGFDGPGDFDMDATGRLARRSGETAEHVYAGAYLVHPRLFRDAPEGAFSMNQLWNRALAKGRLHGLVHNGWWLHVGTPDAIALAARQAQATGAAMSGTSLPTVYNIPPDVEFLRALVRAVLEGRLFGDEAPGSVALSRWTILLPTRRSVRALRETFMQVAPGEARMLPVIRALGDVDEDELIINAGTSEIDLPPAASDQRRQFMLAGMVRDWAAKPTRPAMQRASSAVPLPSRCGWPVR
jgi:hypothetical protein